MDKQIFINSCTLFIDGHALFLQRTINSRMVLTVIPHQRQKYDWDCGFACVTMVGVYDIVCNRGMSARNSSERRL